MTPAIDSTAVLDACRLMLARCGLTVEQLAEHVGRPAVPAPRMLSLPAVDQGEPADVPRADRVVVPAHQPPQHGQQLTPRLAQAVQHASSADGITISGLQRAMSIGMQCAWQYLDGLRQAGHVIKAKAAGMREARYFASAKHAEAWVERVERAQGTPAPAKPQACVPPASFPFAPPAAAPAVAALSADETRAVAVHAAKVAASKKAPPPMGNRTERVKAGRENITFSPPKIDDTRMRPAGEAIVTEDTKITRDTLARPTARWQMLPEAPDERWPSFAAARPGIDPATGKAWEARA